MSVEIAFQLKTIQQVQKQNQAMIYSNFARLKRLK